MKWSKFSQKNTIRDNGITFPHFTKKKSPPNHRVPKQISFHNKNETWAHIIVHAWARLFECMRANERLCDQHFFFLFNKNPHCTIVFTVSLEIRHYPILVLLKLGMREEESEIEIERDYRQYIRSRVKQTTPKQKQKLKSSTMVFLRML